MSRTGERDRPHTPTTRAAPGQDAPPGPTATAPARTRGPTATAPARTRGPPGSGHRRAAPRAGPPGTCHFVAGAAAGTAMTHPAGTPRWTGPGNSPRTRPAAGSAAGTAVGRPPGLDGVGAAAKPRCGSLGWRGPPCRTGRDAPARPALVAALVLAWRRARLRGPPWAGRPGSMAWGRQPSRAAAARAAGAAVSHPAGTPRLDWHGQRSRRAASGDRRSRGRPPGRSGSTTTGRQPSHSAQRGRLRIRDATRHLGQGRPGLAALWSGRQRGPPCRIRQARTGSAGTDNGLAALRPAQPRAIVVTRSLSIRLSSTPAPARSRLRQSTTEPPVANGAYRPAFRPSHVS